MPEDGLVVVGTEDLSWPAILMAEGRGIALIGFELTHVRPQVDAGETGFEVTSRRVVPPSSSRAVFWRREPALVSAHHLAGQVRTINAAGRWALVRPHGGHDFLTHCRRLPVQ